MATKRKSFLTYSALILVLVLVPSALVAAGYALAFLIPRCVMLGVNGANGCSVANLNLNPLFAFIASYGQIWFVLGTGMFICVLIPIWIIVVAWKELRKN